MNNKLLNEYRDNFAKEICTDENDDYRRGFYAGCFVAALEIMNQEKKDNQHEDSLRNSF